MTCRENLLSPKNHWWSQESALHDILIELWEILKSICFLSKHIYIYIYIYIQTKLTIKIIGLDFGGARDFGWHCIIILFFSYESCDQITKLTQLRTSEVIHRCALRPSLDLLRLIWWTFHKAWAHKNRLLKLSFLPLFFCVFFFLRRFSRLESRWMGKFDMMRLSYIAKATSVQNVIRVTWRRGPFWLGTSQFADYVEDQTMVLWQDFVQQTPDLPWNHPRGAVLKP